MVVGHVAYDASNEEMVSVHHGFCAVTCQAFLQQPANQIFSTEAGFVDNQSLPEKDI